MIRNAILLTGLAALLALVPVAVLRTPARDKELPPLVIRVDDIQDDAFRDAQIFLLDEAMARRIPFSLAVIPGVFGEDTEIVDKVRLAVSLGSEATIHGWRHEDLSTFTVEEQAALLGQAKTRLAGILGGVPTVLVPPMFSYNEDTISAMRQTGLDIISSDISVSYPCVLPGVTSLPGTVDLSSYSENGTSWTLKTFDAVKTEISSSVTKYGFAVVVTHPQEFLNDDKLDEAKMNLFRTLLDALAASYSLTTLEGLARSWHPR